MIQKFTTKDKEKLRAIKERSKKDFELALTRVAPVIDEIRKFGDKALFKYSRKYDGFEATKNNTSVSREEIKEAYKKIDEKTINALKKAKESIERYARLQMPEEWFKEVSDGVCVGQMVIPLDSVGCYVPGGSFPLVSAVLMTVVPAKVAGVKKVVVCTPPKKDSWAIYAACDIAGADKLYRIGGAQAIAAMAYGTESVCKVNKIVGPGNVFVTAAKKLVYGDAGIDFLAGPSEVLILAEQGNPSFIAADMIAQAEHDILSSAVLVTTDERLAEDVCREIESQLNDLNESKLKGLNRSDELKSDESKLNKLSELDSNELNKPNVNKPKVSKLKVSKLKESDRLDRLEQGGRSSFASRSLRKCGAVILADSLDEAIDFANDFAPEHLEIIVKDKDKVIRKLNNFGSLFIGEYSPEAAGDYCSGPNHVLPTGGAAKFRAGLSVMDFVKTPSVQELSRRGLESLKDTIKAMASLEGLEGHRRSVERRVR